jgi:hypothetical protein
MSIKKQSNEFFNKNGWVILDNFLQDETTLILYHHLKMSAQKAGYVRSVESDLYDEESQHYGIFSNCDCLNQKVWNKYAEPVIETLLGLATPMVQEHMGKELVPTYSWSRMYQHGSEMERHVDRDQCVVSGTLCLGYDLSNIESEETREKYCWPIFFGPSNGRKNTKGTPVQLTPGQLCLYKGTEIEHWREPFRGVDHAQVFFHWVEKDDKNNEDLYFDSRPMLGLNRDFCKK